MVNSTVVNFDNYFKIITKKIAILQNAITKRGFENAITKPILKTRFQKNDFKNAISKTRLQNNKFIICEAF